ncbi:MAG: hypothetical protein ABI488_08605 [Polyangiaceae bacterium]
MLSPTLAAAAPLAARAGDEDATVIARERFRSGVAFFDKKEYEKARLAFLQAYALKKHPAVLLNLAQSELRSAHEADAAKHFAAYLREPKDTTDAEQQAAQAGLTAAKVVVAEVDVSVDTDGAEIYIDGTLEALSPLPGAVYMAVGTHTVEARKDGQSEARQVSAAAGKQLKVRITLAQKAAPAPVTSSATAGATPPPEMPAQDNAHSGRKPFFKWLVSSPVGLVGLGLTGAGAAGGVGFGIASRKAYSNSDSVADQINGAAVKDSGVAQPDTTNLCNDPTGWLTMQGYAASNMTPTLKDRAAQYSSACAKYPDNVHKGDTFKTLSTVGFVVGGVAAVGTIIYYFVDPKAKDPAEARAGSRRMTFVPTITPGQAGLTVLGSF